MTTAVLGCSSGNLSDFEIVLPDRSVKTSAKGPEDIDSQPSIETAVSTFEFPNPARENPFEFAVATNTLQTDQSSTGNEQISLVGILGVSDPKIMLRIGGDTRVLKEGEIWGNIQVLEVDTPDVRLEIDGITRTWSLVGRQSSGSENNE